MQVTINGDRHQLEDGVSLSELLENLELTGKRVAVEINESIVPKSQHSNWTIQADDTIEIIHAIGGG